MIVHQALFHVTQKLSQKRNPPPSISLVNWCSRRESNPHHRLRRPMHYPLCYRSVAHVYARYGAVRGRSLAFKLFPRFPQLFQIKATLFVRVLLLNLLIYRYIRFSLENNTSSESRLQKIPALFFGDRQRGALHHFYKIFPDDALRAVRLVAQNIARVVSHHQRATCKLAPLTAQLA